MSGCTNFKLFFCDNLFGHVEYIMVMTSCIVLVWFGQKQFRHIQSHMMSYGIGFIGHHWSMWLTSCCDLLFEFFVMAWLTNSQAKLPTLLGHIQPHRPKRCPRVSPSEVICVHLDLSHQDVADPNPWSFTKSRGCEWTYSEVWYWRTARAYMFDPFKYPWEVPSRASVVMWFSFYPNMWIQRRDT